MYYMYYYSMWNSPCFPSPTILVPDTPAIATAVFYGAQAAVAAATAQADAGGRRGAALRRAVFGAKMLGFTMKSEEKWGRKMMNFPWKQSDDGWMIKLFSDWKTISNMDFRWQKQQRLSFCSCFSKLLWPKKMEDSLLFMSNNWRFKEEWRIVPRRFYQGPGGMFYQHKLKIHRTGVQSIKQTHLWQPEQQP